MVHQLPASLLYLQRIEVFPKDYKVGIVDINVVLSNATFGGIVSLNLKWDSDIIHNHFSITKLTFDCDEEATFP